VTDAPLAGDYAFARLDWVLAEHRGLFATPPRRAGDNAVRAGHRTPGFRIMGQALAGRAFPEGAALVLRPELGGFAVFGVLEPVPVVLRDNC